MSYNFDIKDIDAGGRIGQFKVGEKIMDTPNLFTVVNPFENLIPPSELYQDFKIQSIFTNAYILYQKREKYPEIVAKDIHDHLDFPGIIATDSGGFQDYMYAGKIKITPDEIENFQQQINSDCPVILDIPVQTTDPYDIAKQKVITTIERAKENLLRRTNTNQAWFGPIHGNVYPDLLKQSAEEMSRLDFGIYAIGGVVKTFIDYRFDLDIRILLQTKKYLRPDRPLHFFGLGLPAFFSLAVACGADTFDSAAYILYAKDNRYFTLTGTRNLNDLEEFPCHCPICTKYTPAEVRAMERNQRTALLARHNLYHSYSELRTVRQAIREGTLWDLVEQRVGAHPKFIKALFASKEYPDYFQNMLNSGKTKGQKILSDFSFYRPIFQHARERLSQFRYTAQKPLVLLPELDLPSMNGKSISIWIKKISKQIPDFHLGIVSNLFGIIPEELCETFPFAQNEGTINIENHYAERDIVLNLSDNFLQANSSSISNIHYLIPSHYIDEYEVQCDFDQLNSLITYLIQKISNNDKTKPNVPICYPISI